MPNEYEKNSDNLKKSAVAAFEQIDAAAEKVFANIEENSKKTYESVGNSVKKAVDYQVEYEELMSQKKIRTLSDYETKRLRLLQNGVDFYTNLRNMEFDDIKTKLALGEISNEEYYSALAILRDEYFQKGSKKWNQYTLEIAKYNQDVISEQQKTLEEMLNGVEDKYSKSYENILEKQNNIKDKLNNGLKIYETVYFSKGGEESEWLRLSNIDEELQILKRYNDSLINAKNKVNEIFDGMGMDEDKIAEMESYFFEQITQLSIGKGTAFANHISFQPDDELKEFIEKWVEKMDLTEAISKNLYADESERLIRNYASDMSYAFTETLNDKFGKIPDTFFTNGEKSAIEFKNGFMSVIDDVVDSMSNELSNKISGLMPDLNVQASGNSVTNNSSFNIYETSSPTQTALEIYKQEEKKKMLVGG